jgi:hypothetical protein
MIMITSASVYSLNSRSFLLSLVKIRRGWCCEASINLANRARSIQPYWRMLDIDTLQYLH